MESRFGPEIREEIIERLREGESMRTICRDAKMPDRETVRLWAESDADFSASIARAREEGFDARADKAVEDAKGASDPAKGRLAFDAERWYLSKLAPKRYGDKLDLTSGNQPLQNLDDAALDARIAEKMKALG